MVERAPLSYHKFGKERAIDVAPGPWSLDTALDWLRAKKGDGVPSYWERVRNWSVRLEFEPRDLWFGVHWKRTPLFKQVDVWVCVVPMLPLHFSYRGLTLRITSAYRSAEEARHVAEYSASRNPHHPGGIVRRDHD